MKQIIGKQAHWGRHTFQATKDDFDGKECIRIDVLDWLKRHEATYFVENKKQLVKLSKDETSALRFYTGDLGGWRMEKTNIKKRLKSGRIETVVETIPVPTIDVFLECFKYDIEEK